MGNNNKYNILHILLIFIILFSSTNNNYTSTNLVFIIHQVTAAFFRSCSYDMNFDISKQFYLEI